MGVISIILIISLLITTSPSTSSALRHRVNVAPPSSSPIRQACRATRNQTLCESSLAKSSKSKPIEIIQSALSISSENLHTAQSNVKSILASSSRNLNLSTTARNCIDNLRYSDYRLNITVEALRRGGIKDARAWTSAGLAYQYGCWLALKDANDHSKIVVDTVSILDTSIVYMSNALNMIVAYDVYGDKLASWSPPKTEREGFWECGGAGGVRKQLGVPAGLKVDVTVCKGRGCKYTTVQAAVNGAPNWSGAGPWFVILVKAGVYKETVRLGLEKQNIVFLGEGMGKTIITGSMNVGQQTRMSTYNSATVGVVGDRFMASNLTIENTAGPEGHQAVAFRTASDQSIMENCEFLGNQDTLYVHTLRQFFKSCRIQGNVDFIFGNSAAIFQDCTILIRPRQVTPEKGETNAVTAHARNDPAMSTGFVFQNCLINGTEEYMKLYNSNPKVHKSFLGRPWKEYARIVFIGCKLEVLITPEGWAPWKEDFGLKTLYYGEFNNSGKGSGLTGRVPWSNRIPPEHVNVYSITNFIQGDQWKATS